MLYTKEGTEIYAFFYAKRFIEMTKILPWFKFKKSCLYTYYIKLTLHSLTKQQHIT